MLFRTDKQGSRELNTDLVQASRYAVIETCYRWLSSRGIVEQTGTR
jgi:hypothetical protein